MHDELKYLLSQTRSGVYYSTKFLRALAEPTPNVARALDKAGEFLDAKKPIIYVAGSLTHASPELNERYEAAGQLIQSIGGLSYLPHEHGSDPKRNPDIEPEEIWVIDFLWFAVLSRAVVIWADPPSLGAGIQLGWADTYQIPAALLAPADRELSRLARAIGERVKLIRYTGDSWTAPLQEFLTAQLARASTGGGQRA